MATKTVLTLALAVGLAGSTLTACKEGPAERAGEQIDGTTSGAKDKLTPDKKAEEMGKKIDKATEDAARKADDAMK